MVTINSYAIIAEYNPLHNGHLLHQTKTKEILGSLPSVCVMSGNFTQRGEPAIADKWTRASWAINSGFDLVLELPTVYAIQSANRFAGGAVNIIKGIGCVSNISFGCETDSIDMLKKVVDYKTTDEYANRLTNALKEGNSYARAHEIAIDALEVDKTVRYENPNCLLAIEYLSFLQNSNITPTIIKRNNSHNDETLKAGITSATSIRKSIHSGNFDLKSCLPNNVYYDLVSKPTPTLNDFYPILLSKIFSLKPDGIRTIHGVIEGLENRIYQAAMLSTNINELLEKIKSKRYLYTRLQRIMLYILLDITKDFMNEIDKSNLPVYARILALNPQKKELLSSINPTIPIIAKAADYEKNLSGIQKDIFEKDILATQMYSIFSNISPTEDFTHKIVKKAMQ